MSSSTCPVLDADRNTTANGEISYFYVVPRVSEQDAIRALRALDAFLCTSGGRVRLEGLDRVVVWRDGATLYVSPGALSLTGYLHPDPDAPRPAELCGPEMTPSWPNPEPAMAAAGTIQATELPSTCVLMLGRR